MARMNGLWVFLGNNALAPGRVNWIGVVILLLGAGIGFFAVRLAGRLWPDRQEERTVLLRYVGVGLALVGTLIAVRLFG